MDEREVLEGLRGLAVLDEPELGFDPDVVAERAVKRFHTRRTVFAVGVAAIAVTGLLAVTTAFGHSSSGLPVDPAIIKHTDPVITDALSPDFGQIKERLRAQITRLVPDARQLTISGEDQGGEGLLLVSYKDTVGPAELTVWVYGPNDVGNSPRLLRLMAVAESQPHPDGELYLEQDPLSDRIGYATFVRPHKSVVSIDNLTGPYMTFPNQKRSQPPLTDKQLTDLITSPELYQP